MAALAFRRSDRRRFYPQVFAALIGTGLFIVRCLSPGFPDSGDGVYHYQFARYSWWHPKHLLDLWAKPLFTLLCSPFAQLGISGPVLFNVLCALITVRCMQRMFRRSSIRVLWAAPILLFGAPMYTYCAFAGLTEPLFGLLTALSIMLLLEQRYAAGAMVMSFLPFARPEYLGVLPFFVWYLLRQKQGRALPWLLLGYVLYLPFGWSFYGDPLWLFTRDPYRGVATYGSGPLWHFTDHGAEILGWPLIIATLLALFIFARLVVLDRLGRRAHLDTALLTAAPVFAIWALHSVAWMIGGQGSAGMLRVLATTVPLLAIFCLYTFGTWAERVGPLRHGTLIATLLLVVYAIVTFLDVTGRVPMPAALDHETEPLHRLLSEQAEARSTEHRLNYLHPCVAVMVDADPWDTTRVRQLYGSNWWSDPHWMSPGERLVWDSHFAAGEAGMSLDTLLNDPTLHVIGRAAAYDTLVSPFHMRFETYLFERCARPERTVSDTIFSFGALSTSPARVGTMDTLRGAIPDRFCSGSDEYPWVIEDLTWPQAEVVHELVVQGSVHHQPGHAGKVLLVLTGKIDQRDAFYSNRKLEDGSFEWRIRVPADISADPHLYFWNEGKQPFTVDRLRVLARRRILTDDR